MKEHMTHTHTFRARPQEDRGFHPDHIEHAFLHKEYITPADVRAYVQTVIDVSGIAQETDITRRRTLVLDVLNFDTIRHWIATAYPESLDDLETSMMIDQVQRIRTTVLETLAARDYISPRDIIMLDLYFNDQQSDDTEAPVVALAQDAHGSDVVFRDWKPADYRDDSVVGRNLQRERKAYTRAMRVFLSAVAASPIDARLSHFPEIISMDSDGKGTVVEHLPLVPLSTILHEVYPKERYIHAEDLVPELMLLLEAMKAATFLEDHGLVLRDICPQNIALDITREIAVLHDIGALVLAGEQDVGVVGHKGFFAPETSDASKGAIAAATPEMVYQFGRVLEQIIGSSHLQAGQDSELYDIASLMTCKQISDRVSLRTAISELNAYIDHITL